MCMRQGESLHSVWIDSCQRICVSSDSSQFIATKTIQTSYKQVIKVHFLDLEGCLVWSLSCSALNNGLNSSKKLAVSDLSSLKAKPFKNPL